MPPWQKQGGRPGRQKKRSPCVTSSLCRYPPSSVTDTQTRKPLGYAPGGAAPKKRCTVQPCVHACVYAAVRARSEHGPSCTPRSADGATPPWPRSSGRNAAVHAALCAAACSTYEVTARACARGAASMPGISGPGFAAQWFSYPSCGLPVVRVGVGSHQSIARWRRRRQAAAAGGGAGAHPAGLTGSHGRTWCPDLIDPPVPAETHQFQVVQFLLVIRAHN